MPIESLTFGCRLNTYESAVMAERAAEAGLGDALIVNTCAVTAEAVRKARQAIRRARREAPGRKIVVSGCAAQIEPMTFAAMPEVDLVLGNQEKLSADSYRHLPHPPHPPHAEVLHSAPSRLAPLAPQDAGGMEPRSTQDFGIAADEKIRVGDISSVRETAAHMLDGFTRARAFVQVQNGCDHRCTFCVIPFGRGPSRSVPMGAVVEEIRRLTEKGFRETVLTGVDITAWGADLPGRPRLGMLVRAILKHVPALERLRLSSIDSVEADDVLLRALAEEARLMPHLHLSLQSGDDTILKRMKRRHLRADAIRFCETVRKLRPDIVLGADLIAGFPTETEAMFQNTLSAVEECGLTFLHVFPYSPREMTPAARMPQVAPGAVHERARRLQAEARRRFTTWGAAEVGKTRRVLIEGRGRGHTEHYGPVEIDAGARGDIVSAENRSRGSEAPVGAHNSGSGLMAESRRGLLGRLFGGEASAPKAEEPAQDLRAEKNSLPNDVPDGVAETFIVPPPTTPVSAVPHEPASTGSWWQRLKSGLSRSTQQLTTGIADVFVKRKLDAESLEELEDLLLKADLGGPTAARIIEALSRQRLNKEISPEEVRAVLAAEVEKTLAPVAKPLVINAEAKPFVILVVGVNGTGKTTTIGKLAARLRDEGRSVMLAAGDTFRAAAIEQLKIWGERAEAPVIAREPGSNSASLAFDAMAAAAKAGTDVLLIDTAGRLHNKAELMAELAKVLRVIRKQDASAPHAVLLTLDATTGQNAMNQVEVFRDQAGVTGLVMTKLDGTARGGILVAIAAKTGLPVHFIGVGEAIDDLQPFSAADFAKAIAGVA